MGMALSRNILRKQALVIMLSFMTSVLWRRSKGKKFRLGLKMCFNRHSDMPGDFKIVLLHLASIIFRLSIPRMARSFGFRICAIR